MYEAAHASPDGDATVSRLALTAAEYGFDGLVVRSHGDRLPDYDPERIATETGIDVVRGVELRAEDPQQASGYLGNYRPDYEVVVVHGGAPAMNRFAVEQPKVDVLAHPMSGEGDFNHVLARTAAENGVRIELSLQPALQQTGGARVQALQDLRKLHELVTAYDTPFVVSADARSHLQLRAPRELLALGEAIGIGAGTVEEGLAEWRRLTERNRERHSEEFIEPGVRRGQYEEEP